MWTIQAGLLNRSGSTECCSPSLGRPLNCAMKFGRCCSSALSSPVLCCVRCVVRRPFTQLPSTFAYLQTSGLIFLTAEFSFHITSAQSPELSLTLQADIKTGTFFRLVNFKNSNLLLSVNNNQGFLFGITIINHLGFNTNPRLGVSA